METIALILVLVFVLLLLCNVPIAVSIAIASFVAILAQGLDPDVMMAQKMANGVNSFALLAIPFFIFSGILMGRGGMARRLIDFAGNLVGWLPGGLAYVNTLTCMLFGSISGSAAAAVSSVGGFMIPEMDRKGYNREFNVAVTTTAATTGLLIPPSNIMIVYSVAAGSVSIAAMFMAGIFPGILTGICIMVVCAVYALIRKQKSEGMGNIPVWKILLLVGLLLEALFLLILGGVFDVFVVEVTVPVNRLVVLLLAQVFLVAYPCLRKAIPPGTFAALPFWRYVPEFVNQLLRTVLFCFGNALARTDDKRVNLPRWMCFLVVLLILETILVLVFAALGFFSGYSAEGVLRVNPILCFLWLQVLVAALVCFKSFRSALLSLLLVIIVIGGILAGFFTATEAAAIAVVYSFYLAVVVYREVKPRQISEILLQTGITTAVVMLLIGASMGMSWIMTMANIPQTASSALLGLSENPLVILLTINLLLLFVGTFMDMTPAVLIFTPIFLPVVTKLGMDPLHFGIMIIANLCIGLCTPPVGTCLFVGCGVGKSSIARVTPVMIFFFLAMFVALMLITYVPWFSMWLPGAVGLLK